MPDVIFIATAKAKPGNETELERALRAVAAPTRAQRGCVEFTLYRSEEDPSVIVSVERWKSKADHERRLQGPHFRKLGAAMADLIAGPPQIVGHQVIDEAAEIQHSVQIAAKQELIYPLVATADGFRQWWATDVTEPAGAVELAFFNRSSIYRLRRQIEKPPAEVEWSCETGQEWAGTRIRFRLEAAESGTVLHFNHAGWQTASDYFVSCNTAWGELVYRLKSVAQGKARGPLFSTAGMAY
jgi:quinol monooxygenase YgiN/uncharacterized protein YndB with AHSA1/START domain